MIKYALILLSLTMGAQAHVPRFPLEEQLSRLYLDVEVDANRIYMQKLGMEYVEWVHAVNDCIETREDATYLCRISHMFGEVFISYQYGNQGVSAR